jgi:predicted TIM-barrel fold metal-dependent hydrolase
MISLPLPHIDASLRELERGYDELGLVGVNIHCTVFDKSPVEAEYEPLYAELDRRGAVVFFHPTQNGICSPLINDYKLTTAAGASMEDTVIALHLIAKSIPVRYPNVKFVIPHFGGLLPMQLERLDNQMAQQYENLPEKPSATARRMYYDTVGHGSQAALMCSHMAFGAEHLVTGSDWPVLLPFESYGETFSYIEQAELSQEDREQILHRSAAALYGFS